MKQALARRVVVLVALLVAAPGCAGGGLGEVLGGVLGGGGGAGGQSGELVAEIQAVDPSRQAIQVRTQDGRTGTVRYTQQTQVVYRQQQYPVTALERGDVVTMRLAQDQGGTTYTDYILVQQSVQERTGQSTGGGQVSGTGVQRVDGTVTAVNQSQGAFQLRLRSGALLTVTLPYNPAAAERQRFQQLREDQYVSVEGRLLSQDRLELIRFL